jgi:hypothetical protein
VESEKLLEVSLADYKCKKRLYVEAKDSFEEILLVKRKIKDQMIGFMKMYEVRKESTFIELSNKLQQSEKFKTEHTF